MRVHRPTYTKNGRRRRSSRWHVHFQDARGTWRRLPAFTDKGASEQFGRRLEKLAALRYAGASPDSELARWLEGITADHREKLLAWGLLDAAARALTEPLADHVEDFHRAILARDTTPLQADQQRARCLKVFRGCGFAYWSDIRGAAVEQWLSDRRKGPQLNDQGDVIQRRLKMRTSNFYLGAVAAFCRWMRDEARAASDPLRRVKTVRVTDEQERGVFTVEQVETLLAETARQDVARLGIPASDRCVLYRLAADTAQRYGVLRLLTAASFITDKDGDLLMKVEARHQKNRRRYDVPIRDGLAGEVRKLIARAPADRPLFDLKHGRGASMLRADLEAAELPGVDEEGNPLLFHSFRHTATTWLLEAGVGDQACMAITGHKTRSMLDRYGHRRREAAKAAQAKLPELRATGTDDRLVAVLDSEGAPHRAPSRDTTVDSTAGACDNAFSDRWGGRAVECAGLENR